MQLNSSQRLQLNSLWFVVSLWLLTTWVGPRACQGAPQVVELTPPADRAAEKSIARQRTTDPQRALGHSIATELPPPPPRSAPSRKSSDTVVVLAPTAAATASPAISTATSATTSKTTSPTTSANTSPVALEPPQLHRSSSQAGTANERSSRLIAVLPPLPTDSKESVFGSPVIELSPPLVTLSPSASAQRNSPPIAVDQIKPISLTPPPRATSLVAWPTPAPQLAGEDSIAATEPASAFRADACLAGEVTGLAPGATSGANIRAVPYLPESFAPPPISSAPYDPWAELATYRGKYAVPVQRPWVEFWRPLYGPGIYPPARNLLGDTNLLFPHFYVYGDYRTAVGVNQNQSGKAHSWAHRLNLDLDLQITATERIHGFMGPLDKNNEFTRLDFSDGARFETVTDAKFDTLYFEGDAGAITGGLAGVDSPFDLPFTFGLVPLLYQNGIWMEDAMLGAAVAIPARNNPALDWSNFDATFFAVGDQITSDAFAGSNSAAEALGTAWFIDAYDGYIELDYAYVHDDVGLNRSYNNVGVGFTRRYLSRVSNSVRFISNFGQDLPETDRTADGYVLLVENSLISSAPNTFVPYCNFFYGAGRPQSAARAAGSGGILRNTGINFESDGLTGYPTLDPTAANTYGAALGVNMVGANFRDQLVLEAAALGRYSRDGVRRVPGDQFATGVRYQRPLSHRCILRMDSMVGFLRNAQDIAGSRVELRWKF